MQLLSEVISVPRVFVGYKSSMGRYIFGLKIMNLQRACKENARKEVRRDPDLPYSLGIFWGGGADAVDAEPAIATLDNDRLEINPETERFRRHQAIDDHITITIKVIKWKSGTFSFPFYIHKSKSQPNMWREIQLTHKNQKVWMVIRLGLFSCHMIISLGWTTSFVNPNGHLKNRATCFCFPSKQTKQYQGFSIYNSYLFLHLFWTATTYK